MKQSKTLRRAWILAVCIACCMTSHAQDWKSILSGVANAVTGGTSSVTAASLTGTWSYTGPDCKFSSDNLLAKAGSEVASSEIESKISEVLDKFGFSDGCTYTFNSDSTFTSKVKGRTTNGTYSFDSSTNQLKLKTRLGLSFTATVSQSVLSSNKMSLLFNADKLMSLLQTVGGKLGTGSSNSTLGTITALLDQYDGMQVGFELQKQ